MTYVHVTEVWSFLCAYQRYSGRPLTLAEKDRYLDEVAQVAARLGARDVPCSSAAVREYLRRVRPELRRGAAAADAVGFLMHPIGRSFLERASHAVLIEAAVDLLPGFARRELDLVRPCAYRRLAVRPAAAMLAGFLQLLLGESPLLAVARERAGHAPDAALSGVLAGPQP